jgi:hypothetical protein
MILGINGQPYASLDEHLPVERLRNMHFSICRGIAIHGCVTPAYFPPKTKNRNYKDMNTGGVWDGDPALAAQYRKHYDMLRWDEERRRYAELANGVVMAGGRIYLREPHGLGYENIYRSNMCEHTSSARHFPNLMRFIYNQLPFADIGRIIIFISNPGVEGQIHRDMGDPESKDWFPPMKNKNAYKKYHFVWMNPSGKKKFFVYDEETDKKHYIDSTCAFFNSNDHHGSDVCDVTTYSIRVDGTFQPQFCKKIGI